MVQKVVNLYSAPGTPGQQVALGQADYTPVNFVSDGTVKAGAFAFVKTVEASGTAVQLPVASATGDDLLGFVERTQTVDLPYHSEASDVYPEGANLTIAVTGDYWIIAPADAERGQAVICKDGEISFGEAGADGDTGWKVASDGDEGDLIIISKH